jgi:hypothetical protein
MRIGKKNILRVFIIGFSGSNDRTISFVIKIYPNFMIRVEEVTEGRASYILLVKGCCEKLQDHGIAGCALQKNN